MSATTTCKECGIEFSKTGRVDKFCVCCRTKKGCKQRICKRCNCDLQRVQGPKKYCKKCAKLEIESRAKTRSLKNIKKRFCLVCVAKCPICLKKHIRYAKSRNKTDLCSNECYKQAMQAWGKVSIKFRENPFQFKLSKEESTGRMLVAGKREAESRVTSECNFCGSTKILGDANQRYKDKSGRQFCDLDCSHQWKKLFYKTDAYEHNAKRKRESKARIERQEAIKHAGKEERELKKRLMKELLSLQIEAMVLALGYDPRKQYGLRNCKQCGRDWFAKDRANVREFCSKRCSNKHAKHHREHMVRSRSIGEHVSLAKLRKKHKDRCVKCNTLCVTPEGYNHPNEATIDHIIPLSKHGIHAWSNVQLLCRKCNTAKQAKIEPGSQLMLPFSGLN